MPFVDETDKVGKAVDAVTSRWKTWAVAGLFIVAVIFAIVAVVKFFL